MSALAYGALTRKREEAAPGTSTKEGQPGLGTYVDALAALVPAEVLAAHAFILTFTTTTVTAEDGTKSTSITSPDTLKWVWWALFVVPAILYALGHFARNWDRWDWLRMLIPSAAFAGWSMGTQTSAFDAVSDWSAATRYAIVVIGALVLGAVAGALGGKASDKPVGAAALSTDATQRRTATPA
jgi:hypothetical protein